MKRTLLLALSAALGACSHAVWRPVQATDAASELSQVTRSSASELNPAVSPDAKAIAYEAAAPSDAAPHIEVMSLEGAGSGTPGKIQYDSGEVRGVEPAWMPDGSGLYFFSRTPRAGTLKQMISRGAGNPPWIADAGEVSFAGEWPAVSPDGSTIALSVMNMGVFHTGWRELRHYNQALGFAGSLGSGFKPVGTGTEPAWSPDGKRLVFVRAAGGHAHLFVATGEGADPQQITEGASDDEEPSWSPDGKRIVFCSANAAAPASEANLFTVRPDGAGLIQLTEGDRTACHPTWGRDGFIYFHANEGPRFHIWRLKPGGESTE